MNYPWMRIGHSTQSTHIRSANTSTWRPGTTSAFATQLMPVHGCSDSQSLPRYIDSTLESLPPQNIIFGPFVSIPPSRDEAPCFCPRSVLRLGCQGFYH